MTSLAQISARVLVAEDNPINQEVTRENLLTFGCDVDIVGDGVQALKAWESGSYDVILMDCQMPEMDGFATTRAIRERESAQDGAPRTPIVALTAHAIEGDREQCLAAGMDDYLAKPFNPDDLHMILRRWALGDDVPTDTDGASSIPDAAGEAGDAEADDASERPVLDPSALDAIRALRREGTPDPLARVITKYLSTVPNELRALQEAAAAGDLDALAKIAHKLKSGSASLGAVHLADLFKNLEVAAKNTEADLVPSIVTDLEQEFGRVTKALESEIEKTG